MVPCRCCSALSWRWPRSVRSGYFASLYFWIDLAATLSMLLDITRLMDLIFQQSTPAGADALTRPDQNKVTQPFRKACQSAALRLWGTVTLLTSVPKAV